MYLDDVQNKNSIQEEKIEDIYMYIDNFMIAIYNK